MEFDLWCIGDLNYLVAVLNALAMLTETRLFENLLSIGLLIAVVLMGCQAMFQAGGIPWGRFLLALIVYAFLFGWPWPEGVKKATVYVQDTYTLQTQPVANVPFGVAAAGSILSRIAHEITSELEQSFSLPHLTEFGFGAPLITLAKGQTFWTGVETLSNGQIAKTLVEYCDKCTSTGVNMGQLEPSHIKTAANPWQAMRWESDIFYAKTWLPGEPERLLSCTEAWAAIDGYLQGSFWTDWNKFLKAQFCAAGEQDSCDPLMVVQSALDELSKHQEYSARDYILAAVLLPAFEEGQIQFNSFMGKPEMAIIVGQGREQRNIQWQAEGSLFMNIARPMMAFFEGFLYAITPFMALLVAFVPSGLSLVGKYFLMFVWVQLWMPILAVLNQYMQIVAQHKLSALIDSDIPLTSIQGHLMGSSAINDWLGVAGVLVASTPAISLALLFGGAITMTHLAGRLQHGDFVNERIARPDVVQPAPIMSMGPMAAAGDSYHLRRTGMEGPAGETNVADTVQSAVASTRTEVQTSGVAAGESLRQTLSGGVAGTTGLSQGVTTHDGRSSVLTTGEAFARAYTDRLGYGSNWTDDQRQQLQGMIYANMGLSGSAGVGPARDGAQGGAVSPGRFQMLGADGRVTAEAKGQISQTFGDAEGRRIVEQLEKDASATRSHDLKAVMQDSVSRDLASGRTAQYLTKYGSDKLQDTQRAFKRHYDAQRRYSEAVQMSRSLGGSARINLLQAAEVWQDRYGSARGYAMMIPGVHEGLEKEIDYARGILGAAPGKAEWVGLARRLSHMARKGDLEAAKSLTKLREEALGSPSTDLGDPQQYKGIAPAGIEAQTDGTFRKAQGLQPFGEGEVAGELSSIRGRATGPMPSREDIFANYQGHADYIGNKGAAELRGKLLSGHEQALRRQERLTGDLKNKAQDATQVASGTMQTMENAARAGWHGAKTVVAGIGELASNMINPGKITGVEAQKTWDEARGGYFQALEAEANARGLSGDQANLYAQTKMHALGTALKERLGVSTPATGDTYKIEQQAKAEAARFFLSQGAPPEQAQELAERETRLIKEAGLTGGINYVAPVGQVRQQAKNLEAHWRSSREQMLMGAKAPSGIKPLSSEVADRVAKSNPIIERAAQIHGVDANLIRAVISQESEGKPGAESPKGAMGLMQLMPETAARYGLKTPEDIKNPENNIMAGTAHLKDLLKQHGSEKLALAAYNAGSDNVHRYQQIKETRHFVPQVLAYREQYAATDTGGKATEVAAIIPQGIKTVQDVEKMTGAKVIE
jgi:conjugal transfer mating pair stabilization protein TraG